jgi:argininosuccinate lyase
MSGERRHPFEGRLGSWPDPRLGRILEKRVRAQLRYLPAQLAMDRAHTVMLAEQGIVSDAEAAAILGVLQQVEDGGPDAIVVDGTRSSLFWYIESALIDALGEGVGGKMHTGRSHNDIMPTVSRLTARDRLLELIEVVVATQSVLIGLATEHVHTIMPGYTALQHGQPWTFGHYAIGWVFAFERDIVRLQAAYANTNRSPLGASALAGTSWPLDRDRTAELLGFDHVMVHSRDAGFGTRDYVAEILAAAAIALSDMNALCSDLYLWSSDEFGLIELGDAFSGTSSFMPQKKNAWAFDWPRGAAGAVVGDFANSLAAMRGSSSTDGSLQDYPERPLAADLELAIDAFSLVSGALSSIRVDADLMLARARDSWTTASNLADLIARERGLSFRAAHGIVGRVVRTAAESGIAPSQLTAADVDRAAETVAGRALGLDDAQVRAALDPVAFVESRVTAGSVNPREVKAMIDEATASVAAERAWLDEQQRHLLSAREQLDGEVRRRLEPA